ncbi:HGL226Cp [Eremothecium sinecaudum]|uniref:HGL226Cp n=1 Tax=Eremothecium sinecaudum TaxID=45286 RepID=A0A0X8HV79_9SACH|nr:HGL226Cp [Eremothecium sinecaudum]AMD22114.1 HGL226Cp [Eremothecium sinecaudum]
MGFDSKYVFINFPQNSLNWQSLPVVTKLLTIAYVAFTSVLWIVRRRVPLEEGQDFIGVTCPILQLVPSQVLRYPISIVTSNLIDIELWKFVVDLINLVLGGAYIEQCWNSQREMLVYTLVIGSITNVILLIVTYFLSFLSSSIRLGWPLDGNYTMLIGFSIVFKQLIPETTIFRIKDVPLFSKNFRFKMLPIFIMTVLTVVQFWYQSYTHLISLWTTFFICWAYLRYYQVLPSSLEGHTTGELVAGDASDTFQLVYFFPDLIKPLVRPIFNKCYDLGLHRFLWRRHADNDLEEGSSMVGSSKSDPLKVEGRRKQLALKVLEQRLGGEAIELQTRS